MRVGSRPRIPVAGRWFYVGGEAVLYVLSRGTDAPNRTGGAIDHFALNAGDLPAFEQRLRAAGQPFDRTRLSDTDV